MRLKKKQATQQIKITNPQKFTQPSYKLMTATDSWKDDDFLSFGDTGEEGSSDNDEKKRNKNGRVRNETRDSSSLPPWMRIEDDSASSGNGSNNSPMVQRLNLMRVAPLVKLHNEIVQFYNLMKPKQHEVKLRLDLVDEIRGIVYKEFGGRHKVQVETFGSLKTGLFLPSSDIDLVITFLGGEQHNDDTNSNNEMHDENDWEAHMKEAAGSRMKRFADAIRREWFSDGKLSYLEVLESARVPIVKFTHKPSNLNVDVSFDKLNGPENADFMNRMIERMPPLKPLVYVLKAYTAARGLNEPYSGGIGSFLLQLMIISFIQQTSREEFNRGRQASANVKNLGSMLLEFFELYGIDFNYLTTGISVRNDGAYFSKGSKERQPHFWSAARPFMLALENPTDTTADVGVSSFRMSLCQRAFEITFKVLLCHVADPVVPTNSILGTIIPVTPEMEARASTSFGTKRDHPQGTKRSAMDAALSDMDTGDSDLDQSSEGSSRYTASKKRRGEVVNKRKQSKHLDFLI